MDLSEIIGNKIENIYVKRFSQETDTFDRIIFQFSKDYLEINVDVDTDEILFDMIKGSLKSENLEELLVNNKIESDLVVGAWIAENHNGYNDVLMIGTGIFKPNIIITVLAAQLLLDIID